MGIFDDKYEYKMYVDNFKRKWEIYNHESYMQPYIFNEIEEICEQNKIKVLVFPKYNEDFDEYYMSIVIKPKIKNFLNGKDLPTEDNKIKEYSIKVKTSLDILFEIKKILDIGGN